MPTEIANEVKIGTPLFISNFGWVSVTSLANQMVNICFTIYASRLVSPSEYGIFSLLLVIVGFSEILTTAGFSSYLIQKPEVDEKTYSTIFLASLIQGILIASALFFLSGPIALFFGLVPLADYIKLAALVFIFLPFKIVPFAQLNRISNFKKISIINLTVNALSICSAVSLLWYGWKVEALFAKIILQLSLGSTLFFLSTRIRWPRYFDLAILKKSSSFTTSQTLADSIGYWSRKVDDFSIAKLIGANGLGLYAFAYNFLMLPNLLIKNQLVQLIFPIWSTLNGNKEQVKKSYLTLSSFLAFVAFPLLFIVFIVCEELVLLLVGAEWIGCVPIIKLLCISTFFEITIIPGTLFKSMGRADLNLKSVGITKLISLVGIVIASYYGNIVMVAQSLVFTNFVNFFIFGYFVNRIAAIPIFEVLKSNYLELVVCLPFLPIALGIESLHLSLTGSILWKTVLGLVLWLLICSLVKPYPYKYLLGKLVSIKDGTNKK